MHVAVNSGARPTVPQQARAIHLRPVQGSPPCLVAVQDALRCIHGRSLCRADLKGGAGCANALWHAQGTWCRGQILWE